MLAQSSVRTEQDLFVLNFILILREEPVVLVPIPQCQGQGHSGAASLHSFAFCPELALFLISMESPFEDLVSQAQFYAIAVVTGAQGVLSDPSLSMLTCHNYPE